MRDTQVVIALGKTVYSNEIKQKKITIDALFDILAEGKTRKSKDGPYFIFASFKENKRNASNVKFYYGATLDLDNTSITPKEIRGVLKPLKCLYCFYSTHSHKAEGKGNRYRIVVPYSEPVSPEKHVDVTIYLNSLFGASGVDTSSKALSRPMYLPAYPSAREKYFYFYESRNDKLLNPEKEVEIPAYIKWEINELNYAETSKLDITEEITEGGRNEHIARITGTLIQQGKTLQEIVDFCDEINQLKFNPPMKTRELATTVKSIWKSHTRNHEDKGWGYHQLLDRIKKTDSIERDLEHLLEGIADSLNNGKTSPLEADKLTRAIKKRDKDLSVVSLRKDIKEKQNIDKTEKKKKKESLGIDEDLDSPIIDKVKKEFESFYFVSSINMLYHRLYEMFYKLEGFNNQYTTLKQDFGYTKLSPFRILDEISAIKKVDAVKYHPGKEAIYRDYNEMKCLNSFKKSKIEPHKGRIKPLLKHFKYLFKSEFERNVILDFIAFNYQNPGEKLMWTPIIKGKKGIGKSIIANNILAPLFGYSNINQLNNSKPLLKEFNSWQTESQIVVIHELYISNRLDVKQEVTEGIKSFITDMFLSVRKMHNDAFQTENVTNMMAFTNHEDSLYITPDERRFCMIRCEVEPRHPSYYKRLVEYLNHNQEAIAYYFANRKIETIDQFTLPETSYTKELIDSSMNWAEASLTEELNDKNSIINTTRALTWTTICHIILSKIHSQGKSLSKIEDIFNGTSFAGRTLRQALVETGFKSYEFKSGGQNRMRINGQLERIWITPFGKQRKFYQGSLLAVKKEVLRCSSEAEVEFQSVE
jgi:hypothetical protein